MNNHDHHVYWITKPGREKNPPGPVLRAHARGTHVHVITNDYQQRLRGKRGDFCIDADLYDQPQIHACLAAARLAGCNVTLVPVAGDGQRVHELKTWPEYFRPILDGTKTFEVRENDRGFAVGDTLRLLEFDPVKDGDDRYTGREVSVRVTYVLDGKGIFGLRPGHVVMGIERIDVHAMDPNLQALLTAAFDAAVVIKELSDDSDAQARDWAMHRNASLLDAMASVVEDVAAQRGISVEQVMEEIKIASTIRDTPDFPEDPEESPFAEPAELTIGEARALAQRWAAWRAYDEDLAAFRRDDADYLPDQPEVDRLDGYERGALLGWVRRRMETTPRAEGQTQHGHRWVMAESVAAALGVGMQGGCECTDGRNTECGSFDEEGCCYSCGADPYHYEDGQPSGAGWKLCELAGWPS